MSGRLPAADAVLIGVLTTLCPAYGASGNASKGLAPPESLSSFPA